MTMASPINTTTNTTAQSATVTSLAPRQAERVEGQSDVRQATAAPGNNSPAAGAASEPAAEQVADAARDLSQYIQSVNRSLEIAVDDELGSTIITVLDSETDEVIRQIPQEEIVELARFIAQQRAEQGAEQAPLRGLLMDREG
jgi:flagellar protein FlaG